MFNKQLHGDTNSAGQIQVRVCLRLHTDINILIRTYTFFITVRYVVPILHQYWETILLFYVCNVNLFMNSYL